MNNNKRKFILRVVYIFFILIACIIVVNINLLNKNLATKSCIYFAIIIEILVTILSFFLLLVCMMHLFHKETSFDYMTGLYSRRKLFVDLNFLIKNNQNFMLVYIDFDEFKQINDNYGHAAGDVLLVKFGKRILEISPKKLSGYRIGGDEFVIIIKKTTNYQKYLEKIRLITKKEIEIIKNVKVYIDFTMGIAKNDFKSTADELLKNADCLMYRNKQS